MNSFKVYLPSNASAHLFPNNSPSNYLTHFENPFDLNGEWEVGVESVCYSSHIDDAKEQAQIQCRVKTDDLITVNSQYPYEYSTLDDQKWKGYEGAYPDDFEKDPTKIESIIATLNSLNEKMLVPEKRKANGDIFHFGLNSGKQVTLEIFQDGFTLGMSARLVRVLGYGYVQFFSGKHTVTASYYPRIPGTKELRKQDYHLTYFDSNIQQYKSRVVIKPKNVSWDRSEMSFIKMWNDAVKPYGDIRVEFKHSKLIIHNYRGSDGILFSPDFANVFNHLAPVFGRGTRWASHGVMNKKDYNSDFWYIDIYTTQLKLTRKTENHDISIELFPWKHENINQAVSYINFTVENQLRKKLKDSYDSKNHHFQLTLQPGNLAKVIIGDWLVTYFSKNLSQLFSFPDEKLHSPVVNSLSEVSQYKNRERHLNLLSNIMKPTAKPTAFGKQKMPILRNFHHKSINKLTIEKRFEPIIYLPLANNYIDLIQLQLTNEFYEPIHIRDSKTLVTLYFCQVNEKAT